MDQEAFRALLSAPSNSNTSQSRTIVKSSALGSGNIHKSTNKFNASGSSYQPSSASSLKPRKFKSKEANGNSKDGDRTSRGGYRDRASERRQGLDGDFAEAEHLLENFQARVAAAGSQIDKDTLEQQTKYLGGDERHTILVKGLDHALLERRKAELSQGGKLGQVTDEDLETAYEQNAKQSSSTYPTSSAQVSNRKNRDELLEQLKNSRYEQNPDLVVVEKLKAAGKFKPIGSTSLDSKPPKTELKELKRRKTEKKKKKKALKADQSITLSTSALDPSTPKAELSVDSNRAPTLIRGENLQSDNAEPFKSQIKEPFVTQLTGTASSPRESALVNFQPTETAQIQEALDDEDLDIFGHVGDYKGLDGESSEEENGDRRVKITEPLVGAGLVSFPPEGIKKRKTYFEDDEMELDANSGKVDSLESSLNKPIESSRHNKMIIEQPEQEIVGDDTHHAANHLPRLTKLEGLTGSTDIQSILAADAIQEKEEKRKAKKQKNKSDKILTDKDRLNRDFLEMERFLKHKKSPDLNLNTVSTSNISKP